MDYHIEGKYPYGGGLCVEAYNRGEPYMSCSVNLVDYGIVTKPDEIILPAYKMTQEQFKKVVSDIGEEIVEEVCFGPFDAKGVRIRLKDELLKEEWLYA